MTARNPLRASGVVRLAEIVVSDAFLVGTVPNVANCIPVQ